MSALYTHQLIVPQSAIDENGHVNNIEYMRWMQDAATAHATSVGGTLATKNLGAAWVARSHHIEYLRPAFANEHLVVHTWIANVGRENTKSHEKKPSSHKAKPTGSSSMQPPVAPAPSPRKYLTVLQFYQTMPNPKKLFSYLKRPAHPLPLHRHHLWCRKPQVSTQS